MEVNPVKAAIEAYQGVNSVFDLQRERERQATLDTQNLQQRQFENNLQTEAAARAGQQQQMAIESHNAQMDSLKRQKDVAMSNSIKYKSSQGLALSDDELSFYHGQAGTDPTIDYYLKHPEAIKEGKEAYAGLHDSDQIPTLLDSKADPSKRAVATQKVLSAIVAMDPVRFQGMKPTGLVWSKDHNGFSVEVEKQVPVLDDDGKPVVKDGQPVMNTVHRVLSENGKSLEENPNDPVKFYNIKDIMTNAAQRFQVLDNVQKSMDAKAVASGDTAPLQQAIKSEQGKRMAAAIKSLGGDGSEFSDKQLEVMGAVAEDTDVQTAIAVGKAMKKETKPRNLVKVKEPNPKNPNEYRDRLIDQEHPENGYVDKNPGGWLFEHNPKVSGEGGDFSGKKVTALTTAYKSQLQGILAKRNVDLTPEEQAAVADNPAAIMSIMNNKKGVSADDKASLKTEIETLNNRYLPAIDKAAGVPEQAVTPKKEKKGWLTAKQEAQIAKTATTREGAIEMAKGMYGATHDSQGNEF